MKIGKLYYIEGARKAKGIAVIIDVFRAFSTACYVYDSGAEKVILAERPEEAFEFKQKHPESILIGEKGGRIIPGFNYCNSPSKIMDARLEGKTVVFLTSAGTRGVFAAKNADEIITGSFVNAGAVCEYIMSKNPGQASLVCMGWMGSSPADEDALCAEYMEGVITGKPVDFEKIAGYLACGSRTENFLSIGEEDSAPREDFNLCLKLDRFNHVLKAEGRELIKINRPRQTD